MRKVLLVALVSILSLAFLAKGYALASSSKPLVVVTFSTLRDDVFLITGNYARVESVIPAGVDPHSYSLKPSDIKLLENASLIITTLHTPVEVRINEMFEKGLLRAKYIVLPNLTGSKLLLNPNTGKINYHMTIYDPGNYRAFLVQLAHVLSAIDPEHQEYYQERLQVALQRLNNIVRAYQGSLGVNAVASSPPTQYAVSWLGVKILWLLEPEPGLGASPQDLKKVEEILSSGKASLVVVTVKYDPLKGDLGPTQLVDQRMLELAEKYQVTVLRVPNPLSPGSILDKLSYIVSQLREAGLGGAPPVSPTQTIATSSFTIEYVFRWVLAGGIVALAIGVLFYVFYRRGGLT